MKRRVGRVVDGRSVVALEIVERATGVEPATSSLGTITSRVNQGKTEIKRVRFLHFPDRREPCSDLTFRQFPPNVLKLA